MVRALLVGGALIALMALAGSRAGVSDGTFPQTADGGVSLKDSTYCRTGLFVADGGTIRSAVVSFAYYDTFYAQWISSDPALDCTFASGASGKALPDGGSGSARVCTDLSVGAAFGRVAPWIKTAVVGDDGGTGYGATVLADAGLNYNVAPSARIECFGPNIP